MAGGRRHALAAARHQAVEAISVIAPLFLLLFAASYVILAQEDLASFSEGALSRTDALYSPSRRSSPSASAT